ncbi:MAG: hypothetical protein FJW79_05190 [Actinobacteria bacterium]|nr:hypothetical protein [Actinomycetota bacterium]
MVGEGLARAITIGSIVLTVGALAVAFSLARRRTRIRVGFDVARAVVAVAGVLVIALLAHTGAPPVAIVAAIAAGLGVGFAQGLALEVRQGERGFYARRSPIALALWGVGIVFIQVAGIAARTGGVQIGQGIAWFSACLGIGLIVGRNRPLQRARQGGAAGGATVAVVLLAGALIAASGGGAARGHALAAAEDLTAEQLCELYPQDQGFRFQANPGVQTCWADFGDCDGAQPEPSDCGSGIIKQEATAEDAWESLTRHTGGYQEPIAGLGEAAIGGCDAYCTVEFVRDRYWVWWSVDPALGLESARSLAAQVDARLLALLGGEPPPPTTATTSAPSSTTTSGATSTTDPVATSTTGTSTTLPPSGEGEPSDDGEALTPQEAAAQAIAGLIAAAAMGVITWAEAAAGIGEILGAAAAGTPPPEPPPPEEPRPAERPADPCAFQQARYEEALGEWHRIQTEIDAVRSEYRALQLQIEADQARDFSGALFDLGAMGYDLLGAEPPTPGVFKAMVEAAKQEFGRAVVKQLIQAAAAGEWPDPATILYEAGHGAAGARDLAGGKLPGGAFGEFFTQSITALLAANRSYDYLKFMDALAAPGAISDPEVLRLIEQSSFEMYFKRVGPWVAVVAKSIDLWHKNKEWGEGVERRNGMRAELTRLGTRIGELEYDLGYATEARDSYRGFLSRCREETP